MGQSFTRKRLAFRNKPYLLVWYWFIPLLFIGYAFLGNPNQPNFVWWSVIAAISCGIPMWSVNYDPISLVSIVAVFHFLFFPLALLINLIATIPGIYESFRWQASPQAMIALTVGMLGLAFGAKIAPYNISSMDTSNLSRTDTDILNISQWKITIIVSCIIPYALIQYFFLGTYFHNIAAGSYGWSESNAVRYGFLGYIEMIVYSGVLLQWRRYFLCRSTTALLFSLALTALPVVVMLPSGSREVVIRPVFSICYVAFLGFGSLKFRSKQLLILTILALSFAILAIGISSYRWSIGREGANISIADRFYRLGISLSDTSESIFSKDDTYLRIIGRRLGDYPVVGIIVNLYGPYYPYRFFENFEYFLIYLLPNPIRPDMPDFEFRDGAELAAFVGDSPKQGSSPGMLIGDAFSRFSWLGIFLTMAILGFILRVMDKQFYCFGVREIVLYGFMLVLITKIPQFSIFQVFILLTRTLLIGYIVSYIIDYFLKKDIKW